MVIVVIIICVIAWLFIQAAMADQGLSPRTRGSLRYQRRKAAKLGLDPSDVTVSARQTLVPTASPDPPSHVRALGMSLLISLLALVALAAGSIMIAASRLPADLIFVWWGLVIGVVFLVQHRRKRSP